MTGDVNREECYPSCLNSTSYRHGSFIETMFSNVCQGRQNLTNSAEERNVLVLPGLWLGKQNTVVISVSRTETVCTSGRNLMHLAMRNRVHLKA